MKPVSLKFVDYEVGGFADLTLWGGGDASIEMKPYHVNKIRDITLDSLNDNGFGVQSINGAVVDIYKRYENNYVVYSKTIKIGRTKNVEQFFAEGGYDL